MFRIRAFSARNFRSLRQVELGNVSAEPGPKDLPPVVLLYGQNGAGKSNVIDAIATFVAILRTLSQVEGGSMLWEHQPGDEFELRREELSGLKLLS